MDIDPQRKTWSNFIKLTTYTSVAIVISFSFDGNIFIIKSIVYTHEKFY